MSPENVKTILRTFADVYPHVALFSAEDLSSDTILVGSFSPIAFQFDRLNEIMADERIRREMNRAYVFSPTDLFARILLSDRSEVIAYTNGPDRDTWAGLPINTDDNAHIEFAAPRDLISFRRFQGYLATIYTWEWPFGRMMGKVSGLGEGASRAEHLAMMSTSLLMNGRKEEAKVFAKEALRISPDHPSARSATRMADLLTEAARDPGPAFADPETTTPTLRRLQRALSPVLQAIKKKAYRRALILFVAIPEEVRAAGGPVMSHLQGYLHFLNADPSDSTQCEEAITVLTGLLGEDEAYALSHPDIFYYLGLCHDNALHFDKAVKYTRRYVALMEEQAALEALAAEQARANLEAALQGISGTAPIPLPPDDPAAPTTDAAGESAKEPNVTPL